MTGRAIYLFLCLPVLALALVSRELFEVAFLPTALWAVFFYCLFRFTLFHRPRWKPALLTLAFSLLIEFSQLFHAPFIDRLRDVKTLHYLLGSQFDAWDILAYIAGIGLAYLADNRFRLN